MYNNLDWLIPKINAVKKEVAKLSNKFTQYQKKLTAGDNITIENNVISASGGGGGGAVLVTVTFEESGNVFVGTADKSYSELYAAYISGVNVVATVEAFDTTIGVCTCIYYADDGLYFGMPMHVDVETGSTRVPLYVYSGDGGDVWTTRLL